MERLPKETCLLICSYLDFESRFQFAYVCKFWHSIISNHNLYETVYIDRDHNAPIDFFANNKDLGSTVKSLQVNGVGITFSHIQKWPNHFPHLQNLSLAIAEADIFSSDYEEEFDEDEDCYEEDGQCFNKISSIFKNWSRLASISEFTKYMYTGSILLSGNYPSLTSIDLNFNLIPDDAVDYVMEVLIRGVKSAPNLKYLKLIVAKLTLKKLHLLHHNAPRLEGLVLEDISFGEDSNALTETAVEQETANLLTRLEMQGNRYSFYENENLTIPDWLNYISQKYPNIKVLKLNQFTPASIEYEAPIVHTVYQCKKLKTFNVDFCHLSTSVLSAFDQTAIQLEKYSSQSQDITELRNLSVSKQRHSIYRVDLVVPVGNTDLIQILGKFTGLTTINTYPSSDIDYTVGAPLQVPLNTFLKQHKLLEFLSLSSCIIYLDEKEAGVQENYTSALDTLEMEKVTMKNTAATAQTVFGFISNACPSLKVLILTARFQEYPLQHVTKLNLSNHTIVYMKVYIEGHTHIQLHQHESDELQWFKFEREGKKIKYVQQMEDLPSKDNDQGQAGILKVDVKQVERFVINVPRDPFEI